MILNKGTDINISWQEFIKANNYDKPREIEKQSDYVMNQQNKLLGHVIRAHPADPMRQPTITNQLVTPGVYTIRVGRPRMKWVQENCKCAYNKQFNEEFDINDETHVARLIKEAEERKF